MNASKMHILARWYWALEMPNGKIAALPSLIGRAVENIVRQHRRERKLLHCRQPNQWLEKLVAVNAKVESIVFDLGQNALATSRGMSES